MSARIDIEAHDRAERAHLPACDVVARMRRQARVVHGCHIRSRRQPFREAHRGLALPGDAHRQRRQRPVRQPDLHRPRNRAMLRAPGAQGRRLLLVSCRDVAEDQITMAGDCFRVRRDDEVGAKLQRLL